MGAHGLSEQPGATDDVASRDEIIARRDQHKPEECMNVDDKSDGAAVAGWLDQVIPNDADELTLLWDRRTAAKVPRVLFVRRWDDFWYPSSDDLSVISADGRWHLEMRHDGSCEFSNRVGSQAFAADGGRCES